MIRPNVRQTLAFRFVTGVSTLALASTAVLFLVTAFLAPKNVAQAQPAAAAAPKLTGKLVIADGLVGILVIQGKDLPNSVPNIEMKLKISGKFDVKAIGTPTVIKNTTSGPSPVSSQAIFLNVYSTLKTAKTVESPPKTKEKEITEDMLTIAIPNWNNETIDVPVIVME